ncbi:MAG TPA: hypothetical protein VFK48_15490 [Usitatibacter sp.]|nr:hypothetical protein [Usitatibacter sp.]
MLALASCAVTEPPRPAEAPTPPPASVVAAPAPAGPSDEERRAAQAKAAQLEEARALLAQAETDVQRARAKRALWQKAWEELVASRQAVAAADSARAIRHARRASEFAQLGLEQLAYPAVK